MYPVRNIDRISNSVVGVAPDYAAFVPWGPAIPSQPLPPPHANGIKPPFPGFLARVCGDCERMMRSEQDLRANGTIARSPSPSDEDKWESYPWISRTCKWELGMLPFPAGLVPSPTYCFSHKKKLEQLESQKDKNDTWLRNIMLDPALPRPQTLGGGHIVQANQARLTQRRMNGNWRACRCGKELDVDGFVAEVFQCMACSGWVSMLPTGASRFAPMAAAFIWMGQAAAAAAAGLPPPNPAPVFAGFNEWNTQYDRRIGNFKYWRKNIPGIWP